MGSRVEPGTTFWVESGVAVGTGLRNMAVIEARRRFRSPDWTSP